MFCIRIRPSYSPFIFRDDLTTSSILHTNLHVLMRNGEIKPLPFNGFLQIDNVKPLRTQYVKILHIEAFSSDGEFSKFTEIPDARSRYTVGVWDGGGVKVCVYGNSLKTFPLPENVSNQPTGKNGNVVNIEQYRKSE